MNIITLFHGSNEKVTQPKFGLGKSNNDYGRGFYCTLDKELAKEWASNEFCDGYVNSYQLDLSKLRVLDLTKEDHSIVEWICLLLTNREVKFSSRIDSSLLDYLNKNFSIDISQYDVVIGYRADDSYFSFVRGFVNNQISLDQLKSIMKLGELGTQYVLISPLAFSLIKYIDSEIVDSKTYFPKKQNRMDKAIYSFRHNFPFDKDGLFLLDIVRNEIKRDDKRLF